VHDANIDVTMIRWLHSGSLAALNQPASPPPQYDARFFARVKLKNFLK